MFEKIGVDFSRTINKTKNAPVIFIKQNSPNFLPINSVIQKTVSRFIKRLPTTVNFFQRFN